MSTKYFGVSLSEQVEVLDKALEEAVARHVPKGEKCGLLLSGGLDSTLLAGYLERAGCEIVAITEGLNTDNEMKSAKQVAETLGFKHVQFRVDYTKYPRYANLTTTWQHLSEGFTSVSFWGFCRQVRDIAPRIVTGFSADGILGTLVDWSLTDRGRISSFNTLFRKINAEAFRSSVLRKLLKKECSDDLISKILCRIKETHDRIQGLEFQRTWGWGLNQRIRFHDLSGIWPLSFGAWPVLPFADHKILEAAGGFPIESLVNRRVERELLRTKFPKLAKLALAGPTINAVPAVQGSRHRAQQQIYGATGIWRLGNLGQIRNQLIIRVRGERRYWPRQSHFDSPGWRIIRKTAEPYVELTTQLLCKEALNELMPSAGSGYLQVRRMMRNAGLTDTTSLKIILGLALWSRNHGDALTNAHLQSENTAN
jgi:asparagine synthase (glutamine-hydrolysing)